MGRSDNILDIIICLYPPIYHTFSKAPPHDDCITTTRGGGGGGGGRGGRRWRGQPPNNHLVPKYVVPAHICGSKFTVWIFHQAKNNIFLNMSVMFQGNKKLKFYSIITKQTQKAIYPLWAKIMLNQQSHHTKYKQLFLWHIQIKIFKY